MQNLSWIVAALFLPLFPLGMVFNALFQRVRIVWLRVALLLAWPLPGVWILQTAAPVIPDWVIYWALFSAVLYGFRAVVVKEFGVWIGFLATSTWALNWIALEFGVKFDELMLHALAFSLPLSLLTILVAELESRYESAYAGIISGLAQAQPRLSGLFVIAMLAVIGSPLFPAFFSMLDTITHTVIVLPALAVGVATVWLLWSWSGIRLLQDLLVGTATSESHKDVSYGLTMTYGSSLVVMIIGGLYLSRVLL
jgi:NADH:ubiquinone oxidoreductase subunit 4 (subunit M)